MTMPDTHTDAPVLLFEGADWNFETLKRISAACERIAMEELGLDVYRNRLEVISTEQMLDAYSSVGMPLMYRHWSFGKSFARNEALYRAGMQGLAYEIVINSNPCISYIMEENTATMQTLVIAHAAFGHNHFFKNNYLFREWTDADGILDYLEFAKAYIADCEERYGVAEVEKLLDAAHALQGQGVDRYKRKKSVKLVDEEKREQARRDHMESTWNELWTTLPTKEKPLPKDEEAKLAEKMRERLRLPEENVLYFIEKHAPKLKQWQREVIRIVRRISQYFYPQMQTKVMNEGCATYVHYRIMTRLHERGEISNGSYIEFLKSHTNVVFQPEFDDKRFSGINPYALGFAMMQDIERICTVPTDEDREWFPDIAGNGDPYGTLRYIWANFRDESFIRQYLSPKVMRDFRLFWVDDKASETHLRVGAIHDERGYRDVRSRLADDYDISRQPEINITDVNLLGDRRLVMTHSVSEGRRLETKSIDAVLKHLAWLWGYPVSLVERNMQDDAELGTFTASP